MKCYSLANNWRKCPLYEEFVIYKYTRKQQVNLLMALKFKNRYIILIASMPSLIQLFESIFT